MITIRALILIAFSRFSNSASRSRLFHYFILTIDIRMQMYRLKKKLGNLSSAGIQLYHRRSCIRELFFLAIFCI